MQRLYPTSPLLLLLVTTGAVAQPIRTDQEQLEKTVIASFQQVRDGWSSDEVLLQDPLYKQFLSACAEDFPDVTPDEFAWSLLNLRKAGKLPGETARRQPISADSYRHVAEIAARHLEDRHQANMDRVICSPALRAEFDQIAKEMRPDVTAYQLRKAAFGLRKARRLRPELVVRIADWDRQITTHDLQQLMADITAAPERPGIYLFRDPSGYLYIGESRNVRHRIEQHLHPGPKGAKTSLCQLFQEHGINLKHVTVEIHSFDPATKAKETRVRRAYESELIASRKPRFNIRP